MIVPTLVLYVFWYQQCNTSTESRNFQNKLVFKCLFVARASGSFFLAQSLAAVGISVGYQPLLVKQAAPMLCELDPLPSPEWVGWLYHTRAWTLWHYYPMFLPFLHDDDSRQYWLGLLCELAHSQTMSGWLPDHVRLHQADSQTMSGWLPRPHQADSDHVRLTPKTTPSYKHHQPDSKIPRPT